jgi:hypothetical protein
LPQPEGEQPHFAAPSVKYRQFGLMPGDYKTKTVALKVKDAHPYDVYGAY